MQEQGINESGKENWIKKLMKELRAYHVQWN